MKHFIMMSILFVCSFAPTTFAAPGDAAMCLNRCSSSFGLCSRRCPANSGICKYRCWSRTRICRSHCPGAAAANEDKIMQLTNAERTRAGLGALTWDLRLGAAAQGHAANMAQQQKAEHNLNGQTPADRLRAERYSFSREGENIYWGQGANFVTPEAAFRWWMNSPGHRANIMNPVFKNIGVGVRSSADGKWYFSQSFGAP